MQPQDDPWSAPAPAMSSPSVPRPKQPSGPAVRPATLKPVAASASTPVSDRPTINKEWTAAKESDWQDGGSSVAVDDKPSPANISLAGLSKEEKEKEMARRREERKAVSGYGIFCLSSLTVAFSLLFSESPP